MNPTNTTSHHARHTTRNIRADLGNRRLRPGTTVVSKLDGEPGTVVRICTLGRNGMDAWSYLVDTACSREIWHRDDLFLPAPEQA